ncbi:MAG: hypothetical protein IJB64_07830 [Akkermansia sp.]|nr:hypothetical protein [Akkermansia sp.]
MKLHLPTKLLSAVMALYVSQAALSTAWAEGDNTYTIKGDVTYGYEGEPWTGTRPEWTYVDGEHVLNDGINSTFTSEDEKEHSVTFNGKGGAITETAIVGTTVTIENLKEMNFTQFETGSYAIFSKDLTIQNNGKFSVSDNVNTEKSGYNSSYSYYIGGDHILIDNNDEVSLVNNKVFSGKFDEAGNAISDGDHIDGGVIKNYSGDNHLLTTISNNELINISNNSIISAGNYVSGGAIYSEGPILLENNGDISFIGNTAASLPVDKTAEIGYSYHGGASGGAIEASCYYHYHTPDEYINSVTGLSISDNGTVKFQNNSAIAIKAACGGAICNSRGTKALLNNNAGLEFTGNTVVSYEDGGASGGAIFSEGKVEICGNGDVLFDQNTISTVGGPAMGSAIAIMAGNLGLTMDGNEGTITVSGNGTTAYESYYALYRDENNEKSIRQFNGGFVVTGALFSLSTVSISDNEGAITFSDNYIQTFIGTEDQWYDFVGDDDSLANGESEPISIAGGAAIVSVVGEANINNNKSNVVFSGNTVNTKNRMVLGGALVNIVGGISISGNGGTVEFINNSATTEGNLARGGAVATDADMAVQIDSGLEGAEASVKLEGNGGVSFSGNKVTAENGEAKGGAIYSSHDVIISGNKGDVSFSGNGAIGATAQGGAIYAARDLSIVNNSGDVTFRGNYVKNGDSYQLNSIHINSGKVELAAADGTSMTFHDSIYVGEGEAIALNSFSDAEGNAQTSQGAIIFSGATTEADLKAAKGTDGTAEEIAASRTSEIKRNVSVDGGSLQVKDAAVLKINALSVDQGAGLHVGAGSSLEAAGGIELATGAALNLTGVKAATSFNMVEAAAPLGNVETTVATINGDVLLNDGVTITIDGAYADLQGHNLTLTNTEDAVYTFKLDESLAHIEGDKAYFVLFTNAKLTLEGALSDIDFTHNLSYSDVAMGYDEGTGTLFVSAPVSIPEPATATLSLLALAALAARRRRK